MSVSKLYLESVRMLKRIIKKIQHLAVRFASSDCEDVIIESITDKGIITLNRPKVLNSLNLSMVKKILPTLIEWENEKSLVIVKGAGEKAFCAGADVKALVFGRKEKLGEKFFRVEYTMNGIIASYKIPYIALIDGITMGGGVGISVHGKYRVATERTIFAMPETQIALLPDVGTSYFLPRLSGKLGLFLALTGHKLIGYDNFLVGIATHFVHSSCIPELEKYLISCKNEEDIKSTLKRFSERKPIEFSLCQQMEKINNYFSADSVEEIVSRLKSDKSDWAKKVYKTLLQMSPTSLKVSHALLTRGANETRKNCLENEYNVAYNTMNRDEFFEGVRAHLIDKDKKPIWDPLTLKEVSSCLVEEHFHPAPIILDRNYRCFDIDSI